MSIFFNGRLLTTPTVASAVDDSAMFNPNPGVGNVLALIGASTGGQPNTPLIFQSASDAVATLGSGDLVDAITRAFDPSADVNGPATIIALRVNPATQSALILLDGSAADAIDLVSTDYGLATTQIKVKVEAATTTGTRLTTQLGNAFYSQDNVHRNAFSIQYTGGQATATMTVGNSSIILDAPSGTPVATIDLTVSPTIQQVVDRINTVAGFGAVVLDGNGAQAALDGLDSVAAQDVRTGPYTATANLQAAVDWFNGISEGFVTATRHAGAGAPPTPVAFTYLTGGIDGAITNTQWSNAFTTLQSVDCNWVVPLSSDPSIAAMADAHVVFMSTQGNSERRAVCGTALGTTDIAAIAAAKAINSDRTALTHLGGYDYNAAGALTLYAPFVVAAMIAGGFAGSSPGTPMTNKSLKLRGLERNLRDPADTDLLIQGGVMCVENTPTGYRVVKSISTWLTNSNFNRVEMSCGAAVDYAMRSIRAAVSVLKGAKGTPQTLSQAVSITETTCRELSKPDPIGPGVFVGDANNPPYKNITATLEGDSIAIQLQGSPVIPVNYITILLFAVPFSGTASA